MGRERAYGIKWIAKGTVAMEVAIPIRCHEFIFETMIRKQTIEIADPIAKPSIMNRNVPSAVGLLSELLPT